MISEIYFWNKTLHVSDGSSVHHQEYDTYHYCVYSEKPADDGQRK